MEASSEIAVDKRIVNPTLRVGMLEVGRFAMMQQLSGRMQHKKVGRLTDLSLNLALMPGLWEENLRLKRMHGADAQEFQLWPAGNIALGNPTVALCIIVAWKSFTAIHWIQPCRGNG